MLVLTTVVLAVVLSLVLTNHTGDNLTNSESNDALVLNNGDNVTEFSATNKRVLILTNAEQQRLEEQLKIDEGVKYEVYSDSVGKLTFGIGHLITKKDPEYGKQVGTKVSEKRVKEAFGVDLQIVLKDVYAWSSDCNTWPSEVKQIIANMMFNLGRNRMNKFAKLKAAVQAREWKTAANEMADSRWARQVKDRATRLIDRMRNVVSINKQMLLLTKVEQRRLEQQLKFDEGVKYVVYTNYLGFLTFGIGHVITKHDPEYKEPAGTTVSKERVKEAFEADMQKVLKDVYAWSSDCNTWPSEVKQIITNMMFNLGRNRMNTFAKLKAAVQSRNWKTAADEIADSKWAQEVKGRVTRLVDRMRNVAN